MQWHIVQKKQYKEGDVIIIRYEGPVGGPGMREMLINHWCNLWSRYGRESSFNN